MRHFQSIEEVELKNAWVTIGVFDGVHRGHQAILAPLATEAHAAGSPAVVVTFFPHPAVVLRGGSDSIYLTAPDERAGLIAAQGVDALITLTFDHALANWTAETFMRRLRDAVGLRRLWAGADFALGRNRMGDLDALRALGRPLGYSVQVVDEVLAALPPENGASGRAQDRRISSSAVRALVRQGEVALAAAMLGRPYALSGPVVQGDRRGRELGFPTANVEYWPGKIVPAYGVYATWTWIDGQRHASVTSVGVRPTFDPPGSPPRLEAYLIDFAGDLYGRQARIEFLTFLRPELRFDSAQSLIDQMVLDTQNAKEVLAHAA
jgi:riboflavin kinase / FMN adenylyltransferase